MYKEKIIKHFQDLFNKTSNIKRFLIVELRETTYGLFNKKNFNAYVCNNNTIDIISNDEVLMCPYLNVVEKIDLSMFDSFNDTVSHLDSPTLCVFFAKQDETYKCGVFALEEQVIKNC